MPNPFPLNKLGTLFLINMFIHQVEVEWYNCNSLTKEIVFFYQWLCLEHILFTSVS